MSYIEKSAMLKLKKVEILSELKSLKIKKVEDDIFIEKVKDIIEKTFSFDTLKVVEEEIKDYKKKIDEKKIITHRNIEKVILFFCLSLVVYLIISLSK